MNVNGKMKDEEFKLSQSEGTGFVLPPQAYSTIYGVGLIALLFFFSLFTASAQSRPSHSRYVANERWSKEDCMARAKWALEAENYKIEWTGVDGYQGSKGPYAAFILCNPVPDGTMRVNVIVAGNTQSSMPESDRLWMRLRNPGTEGAGGGQTGKTGETPPPTGQTGSQSYNLALDRPTKQSSVYGGGVGHNPKGAVDGVKDGGFGFHTDGEPNPWWQVDLGEVKLIGEIVIYNRQDCCAERARTIQVFLSNDGSNWTRVFANDGSIFGGKSDGKPLRVSMGGGKTARYVRLQLNETNYLHLDEVEIYPVYH